MWQGQTYKLNSDDCLNSIRSWNEDKVFTAARVKSLNYDCEERITGNAYPSGSTNSSASLDTRVSKAASTGTYSYTRDGPHVTDLVLAVGHAT
jgi:hypothetical protein